VIKVATISVIVNIAKTVSKADKDNIDAVLQWIETNIKQKVPAEATLTVTVTITP